ncbi:MAG: DUF6265 family protein [Armatimonadetes bacterium]|nr:DUF6265 family protein [Armatimonadota bacterium]
MSAKFRIEDCAFMTGSWEAEIWGGVFEETWLPPGAGTMVGVGRHISAGRTTFVESMTIEFCSGTWTMFMILGSPSKGDKSPVPFDLLEFVPGESCTFTNLGNDFPTRIKYDRATDGELKCVIFGRSDSAEQSEVFDFRRVL